MAKKKMRPGDLRKQQKDAQKDKFQQQNVKTEATLPPKAELVEKTIKLDQVVKEVAKDKNRNGSGVKAANVKSIFTLGNGELLMTAFGAGNDAVLEKRTEKGAILNIAKEESFTAAPKEKKMFEVKGRAPKAGAAHDPREKAEGTPGDRIRAKDELEKLYFKTTYADNMHIQVIHNIMDIKKILAPHATNIVYALNNMRRKSNDEYDDVIGVGVFALDRDFNSQINSTYVPPTGRRQEVRKTVREFIEREELSYFGSAFYRKTTDKERTEFAKAYIEEHPDVYDKMKKDVTSWSAKPENAESYVTEEIKKWAPAYQRRSQEDVYYALALINELRQVCVHSTENDNRKQSNIYHFDKSLRQEAKDLLDKYYGAKLNDVNGFVNTAAKSNFGLLFETLDIRKDDARKEKLAQDLYDFQIRKTYKNLGFSLRVLREMICAVYFEDLKEKEFDSHRAKINQLFDFVTWDFYSNEGDARKKELVKSLRAARAGEENASVYAAEAQAIKGTALYTRLDKLVELLRPLGKGKNDDKIFEKYEIEKWVKPDGDKNAKKVKNPEYALLEKAVDDVKMKAEGVSYFSKFIYFVTLFLDGKEINDLLTTLSKKMDNIASLLKVIREQTGDEVVFSETFDFFNSETFVPKDTGVCKIVAELRDINSFARMTDAVVDSKCQYRDAALLLGYEGDTASLEQYVETNFIDRGCLPAQMDSNGYTQRDANGIPKLDRTIPNFVKNNVLKSRQFKYLVRYVSPKKARECAKNEDLVKFALFQMVRDDPKILNRYSEECGNAESCMSPSNYLADLIKNMNILSVLNKCASGEEKQKQQKIVSLYLNVLYQIAKNLVYVNARYVIAFHCLERDAALYGVNAAADRLAMVKKFYDNGWLNEHALAYTKVNLANSDEYAIGWFRNYVAHLNSIRNMNKYLRAGEWKLEEKHFKEYSYFQLYHYVMQRAIFKKYAEDGKQAADHKKLSEYKANVEKYKNYSMDFVKALCVPFAYNLPRFKNLAIDQLFDRNDKREKPKKHTFDDKNLVP